jgi:hypothetical protein
MFCRNTSVKASPGNGDGKGVLSIHAAGLHALITEDALSIVADVKLVIDLDGLCHTGGCARLWGTMHPDSSGISLSRRGNRGLRSKPLRAS